MQSYALISPETLFNIQQESVKYQYPTGYTIRLKLIVDPNIKPHQLVAFPLHKYKGCYSTHKLYTCNLIK